MPFQFFGMDHELILGANLEWWDYRSRRFTGPETVPGAASADVLLADIVATQQNRAIYLQHIATLPKGTVLSLGGRLQWVDNRADDRLSRGALRSRSTESYGLRL